jgi:hypothetical protein
MEAKLKYKAMECCSEDESEKADVEAVLAKLSHGKQVVKLNGVTEWAYTVDGKIQMTWETPKAAQEFIGLYKKSPQAFR